MNTKDNLSTAFAGESQANRKYLAFAKQAERDGFLQIAKLFRAIAEAETIHAHAHLRVMSGVQSTTENLRAAMEGEAYEFQKMYPEFLAAAESEKNKGAIASFKYAMAVEQVHHGLYEQALNVAQDGKDLPAKRIWVCGLCGHTHTGDDIPDKCPVCGAIREKYVEIK